MALILLLSVRLITSQVRGIHGYTNIHPAASNELDCISFPLFINGRLQVGPANELIRVYHCCLPAVATPAGWVRP